MLSDGLLNGLLVIPILGVLILIHEIGHFVAARSVGVTVEEFGIGIPPRLKGWTRNGVIWSLNWLPIGGFVRVKGEDANDTDPGSMNTKGPGQRAFFLVAGSAMNFLLAILLMILLLGVMGEQQQNFYVGGVQPDSAAAAAGLQPGDRIVELAGGPVESTRDVTERTAQFLDREMSLVVERDGQLVESVVVPRSNPAPGQGAIGIEFGGVSEADSTVRAAAPGSPAAAAGLLPGDRLLSVNGRPLVDVPTLADAFADAAGSTVPLVVGRDGVEQELSLAVPVVGPEQTGLAAVGLEVESTPRFREVSAGEIIPLGLGAAWEQTAAVVLGVRDLFTGVVPLSEIRGPVGIGQAVSEIVEVSPLPLWVTIVEIMILLSLNLGLLNLLPLPALDGGRLLFVLVEVLRGGRRVSPEREGLVHLTGFVLLIGLMLVILFVDVGRIADGRSFLPQ